MVAVPIDLRSDTVTRPSPEMRAAMAAAPVGDDQYGEDPTTNRLQERVAALLGKEAALWLPSGTMANQVALRVLTRPGDDVIVSRESHAVWHETGGSAANAGVQLTEIGARGVFSAAEFVAAVKPRDHGIYPPTTLVEIENTHNRAGGVVFAQDEAERICARGPRARHRQLSRRRTDLECGGRRPVSASTGSLRPFDMVAVSFSKGLGAPGGSLLAGSRELIARALRHRRMLGGAMRQVGIFAAAALHGARAPPGGPARGPCERPPARRTPRRAPRIASTSARCRPTSSSSRWRRKRRTPRRWWQRRAAAASGSTRSGARTIRALTHRDVTRAQCAEAAEILVQSAEGRERPSPA